uniref:Uncharacterized protein n=1 Tax=Micrurus carvalhoi TaxID=3147026 RepID=A0A2H6N7M8_9SAUR
MYYSCTIFSLPDSMGAKLSQLYPHEAQAIFFFHLGAHNQVSICSLQDAAFHPHVYLNTNNLVHSEWLECQFYCQMLRVIFLSSVLENQSEITFYLKRGASPKEQFVSGTPFPFSIIFKSFTFTSCFTWCIFFSSFTVLAGSVMESV